MRNLALGACLWTLSKAFVLQRPYRYSIHPIHVEKTPTDDSTHHIAGVAVTPSGFHCLLQQADVYAAILCATDTQRVESPQALTLIQLLTGVDMAGAILPPDVLARMLAKAATEDEVECENNVREALMEKPLPICTLQRLEIYEEEFRWTVHANNLGTVVWKANPTCLCSEGTIPFVSLALAIRYTAEIRYTGPTIDTLDDFPQFRSIQELSQTSAQSVEFVTRGYELHRLEAALQMALDKQDEAAATKIRAALQELQPNVPVQAESDLTGME